MKKNLPRISVCVLALAILSSCQLQKETGNTGSVKPGADGQSSSVQTDNQAIQQVGLVSMFNGRGRRAHSRRQDCSIGAESVPNFSGRAALAQRNMHFGR